LQILAIEVVVCIQHSYSFLFSPHRFNLGGVPKGMFSFDSSISLVRVITVVDVRLVISVDTLVGPFVVFFLSEIVKSLGSEPRADHGGGKEVSVVKTYETTGEISPGERHLLINKLRIILKWLIKTTIIMTVK